MNRITVKRAVRRVITRPRDKEGLFTQPEDKSPDREVIENHNRMNFAHLFSFADPYTGNTRTYDEKGNYNCGRCNKADDEYCLVIPIEVDLTAGSCRHWEDLCAGDPELKLTDIETAEMAGYGVAKNGKGFGCKRCPFGEKAIANDSRGRSLYCKKGDFRTFPNACCQINGAAVVAEYEGNGIRKRES